MPTIFTGPIQIHASGITENSSTQNHDIGAIAFTNDGRKFRYAKAGGTSLVVGKLQQASAQVTANQDLTAVAAAVGDTALVSTSTITVTANQYAGGLAMITVTPGVGYAYKIKSHAAFTAAAPTFTLEDPIAVALTTSSRIDLVANPYAGVIVSPATASSAPVGVAVTVITNAQFGWVQVGGAANVLADGAITVGTNVIASNAVAGAIEPGADAADLQASIGVALTGIADTEYGAVMLNLN